MFILEEYNKSREIVTTLEGWAALAVNYSVLLTSLNGLSFSGSQSGMLRRVDDDVRAARSHWDGV